MFEVTLLAESHRVFTKMFGMIWPYRNKLSGIIYRITGLSQDELGQMVHYSDIAQRGHRAAVDIATFLNSFEPVKPDLGASEVD